jgi:hypothetical protein
LEFAYGSLALLVCFCDPNTWEGRRVHEFWDGIWAELKMRILRFVDAGVSILEMLKGKRYWDDIMGLEEEDSNEWDHQTLYLVPI